VLTVIAANDIPRLNVNPRLINVALVPDAKPLAAGGTAFITEALFGDVKIPIPDPMSTRGRRRPSKVTVSPICVSIRNPTEETTRPNVDNALAPCLSEIHPLTGPKAATEADIGIRNKPAVRGSRCIVGPCK
jgi:hypothetical protein